MSSRDMASGAQLARRVVGIEGSAVREILKLVQQKDILSMAGGLPAPELFDLEGVSQAVHGVLEASDARGALQYSLTEGDPELRERLAELSRRRGMAATRDDVLVTTGSQQALDLVTTTLLDPGDVVLVERPCYLAALQLFRLSGLRVVAVDTDAHGLDPDAVEAAAREHGARALYTVPNFQNPTGATLTAERRAALAMVAAQQDLWVIEDDPYGELRYRGTPLPPLAAGDGERTIYLSTLSKVVAPGLRLGWVVAPQTLRSAMTVVKQARDLHTSTLDQRAAAAYLASGRLHAHLARVRNEYSQRLEALLQRLPDAVPAGTTWTAPDGGMFVWLTFPPGTDTTSLLEAAVREGVAFVPGAPFFAGTPLLSTARLSFVTLDREQIAVATTRLGRAVRSLGWLP